MLSVTSQGCADLGVCYPPLTRSYRIAVVYEAPPRVVYAPAPVYGYGYRYEGDYGDERRWHDHGRHRGWEHHRHEDDD
ncbi:hypothetical protein RW095_01490 [Paraburkholderia kirstenboschensis]|uniref:Thiol:disulfide interchange protein DsbD N-terminal domain-containing protein n=1 Tax=Paraburkholderia kirstenboschensis TaxID=1245436 RepID=A0ABZ0EET4_9BURK|nr:hypothetical protein [Paraburkholderia kirstenboschensis]WOD14707.1 hypothetical protein RW095_01490 [Paraburkholderia kirstenboschensis]